MNPLIVLEKSLIKKYGVNAAYIIAFIKENGGCYNGSIKKMAEDLGLISDTWISKTVKKLESYGVVGSVKKKIGEYKYYLTEMCYIECEKTKIHVEKEEDCNTTPKKELPPKIRELVEKIEKAKKKK